MDTEGTYLIVHKLRGEPVFDIAIREPKMDDGDQLAWIIPTSDCAAYPIAWWPLSEVLSGQGVFRDLDRVKEYPNWENLPDYYYRPNKYTDTGEAARYLDRARSVLAAKGLITMKPVVETPMYRRV